MDEYTNDQIIYDNDFHCIDEKITAQFSDNEDIKQTENKSKNHKKPKRNFVSLISIQLVLCVIIIFVLFMLKSMDSIIFSKFKLWYDSLMDNTLIEQQFFEDIDLSEYFKSTADEA